MTTRRSERWAGLGLLAVALAACASPFGEELLPVRSDASAAASGPSPAPLVRAVAESEAWKKQANETHGFVVHKLLTPHGSYRVTPEEAVTDEWHCASQLAADATMLGVGETAYLAHLDATAAFLGHFWDEKSPTGGYAPRAALDGSNVEAQTKFGDDNGLTGVTWLDARDAVTDPSRRAAFLAAARSVGHFLMHGGLWDTTLAGGGFWWNTDRPDKPTQTNGLAVQLFLRLGEVTTEAYYGQWANTVLGWLETTMFDAKDGLFAWKWEPTGRNDAKFTYDQAILIDAYLLRFEATKDRKDLDKAKALADALQAKLWAPEGGYVISTEDWRLSPVFSAWATTSLVHLHAHDPDPRWLERAVANMKALDKRLRDPKTLGYWATARPDGSDVTKVYQAVDQAWMQRAQAALVAATRK